MKKIFLLFGAVVCVLFCTLSLAACGGLLDSLFGDLFGEQDGNEEDSSKPGNTNVVEVVESDEIVVQEYDNQIHYTLAYCFEEECPDGNIEDSFLTGRMKCNTGETCFMVLDFTMDTFEWWDGGDTFSVSVEFSPLDAMDVRLEEAATGDIKENTTWSDYTVTATYKVPEEKSEARSYRIVFRMTLLQKGEDFSIGVAFHSVEETRPTYRRTFIDLQRTWGLRFNLNADGSSCSVSGLRQTSDQTIYIPETQNSLPVTAIGDGALSKSADITAVVIPSSVESIGDHAFKDCVNLKRVEFKYSYGDVAQLTTVGARAFAGCTALEEINLPTSSTVTSIGDRAFADCVNLKVLSLPKTVTSIGDRAFDGVTAYLEIPDETITSVGEELFGGYAGTELTIPYGISSIARGALATCTSLTTLSLPSCTLYGVVDGVSGEPRNDAEAGYFRHFLGEGNAYFGALFGADSYEDQSDFLPASLRSVEILRCNFIDDYAFYGCKGLESVSFQYASYIGDYAFAECSGLTNFSSSYYYSGYGKTYGIGAHAFENCVAMERCALYFQCSKIEERAFRGCTALKYVGLYFDSTTYNAWDIAARVFEGCSELKSVIVSASGYGWENLEFLYTSEFQDPAGEEAPRVLSEEELLDSELLAKFLTQEYVNCNWHTVIKRSNS